MRQTIVAAAIILMAASLTGCRIDTDKSGNGDNVKIATPFGGMQVKTDQTNVLAGIGLPAYPGATLVRKQKDNGKDEDGAADVNMSFGSFQLKVKAASYRTPDSPEKVLAFYKKALNRFGNVIQCQDKHPVGTPTRTNEGLSCDDDNHNGSGDGGLHISGKDLQINGSGSDKDTKFQLKAGSKKHQHIVDINPEDSGTKFGLVSLDLPIDFHFGTDDNDKHDSSQNDKHEKEQ
ncbi:hypothetical protein [Granulicella arctica]|uniref:hypothetical protein n=1 Tax=Granulicella arctica TaxID=940613 RepID=UPI0021E0E2B1|nr:hypothetical protein [Granulicella arctica]